MTGAGAVSDAVLVNLVLDGELEQLLREWRTTSWPPLSYKKIAEEINARIAEVADRLDVPTREFKWSAIRRWAIDIYGINGP